jgi:hypothetical protein
MGAWATLTIGGCSTTADMQRVGAETPFERGSGAGAQLADAVLPAQADAEVPDPSLSAQVDAAVTDPSLPAQVASIGTDPALPPASVDPPPLAAAPKLLDWQGIDPLATVVAPDAGHALQATLRAVIRDDTLVAFVDSKPTDGYYNFFLDSDNNPLSGYKAWQWPTSAGADHLITGGILKRYLGVAADGTSWDSWLDGLPQDSTHTPIQIEVVPTDTSLGTGLQFRVPLQALGVSGAQALGLAFQWVHATGSTENIPATNAFARVVPPGAPARNCAHCRMLWTTSRVGCAATQRSRESGSMSSIRSTNCSIQPLPPASRARSSRRSIAVIWIGEASRAKIDK